MGLELLRERLYAILCRRDFDVSSTGSMVCSTAVKSCGYHTGKHSFGTLAALNILSASCNRRVTFGLAIDHKRCPNKAICHWKMDILLAACREQEHQSPCRLQAGVSNFDYGLRPYQFTVSPTKRQYICE
jgi:hypothetical protein